jgi:hypothetical protein
MLTASGIQWLTPRTLLLVTQSAMENLFRQVAALFAVPLKRLKDITMTTPSRWMYGGYVRGATNRGTEATNQFTFKESNHVRFS